MPAEAYRDRRRAGPAELDAAFGLLGKELDPAVEAWDIGGGPMVYRGLKAGTKDVDLVVDTRGARDAIVGVLLRHGYEKFGGLPGYEGFQGVLMRKPGRLGVDIFVVNVMDKFYLSVSMKGAPTAHTVSAT